MNHDMMNEGLSTYRALRILNDELKILYKKNYAERNLIQYFSMSFNIGIFKRFLIANLLTIVIVVFECLYKLLIEKSSDIWLLVLFFNFVFLITINFLIISLGTKSRCSSIYRKFQLLIDDIQHIMDSSCKGWTGVGNYPFVKIPFANCVNLQWTIRDNQLINLPVALLVKGDIIKLRPGQFIFADCEIDLENCMKNHYQKTYTIGQTFVSDRDSNKFEKKIFDNVSNHKVIAMKSCVTAVVIKTPIIGLIDDFLNVYSKKDAWHITVPERYVQFSVNALFVLVFVAFVLNILLHILWFYLIGHGIRSTWPASISHILLIGVPIQLPLLLFIPTSNIIWKINCLRYKLDRRAMLISNTVSMESIPSSDSLSSSDTDDFHPVNVTKDPMNVNVLKFIRTHWNQLVNQDFQFSKMIYSMGSLTSLCCVDKKGILGDPIATPEKIFIYRKKHRHRSSSLINLDRPIRKSNLEPVHQMNKKNSFNCQYSNEINIPSMDMNFSQAAPVILDMTRSNTHPYLPSFDDNRWERYMGSLKPIGLNILLNNCNPEVTDSYINFTDNMSAINFKNLNKSQLTHRCICALSTQIGFKPSATDRFHLESTFAVCRKNDKLVVNNATNKSYVYSLPVGNVFSTVVKDTVQNNYQLMSQGSADLLMSMCSDYWDGRDICPLTSYDRSRILEFYNRNIFSSYCIGFSYSPLFNKIKFSGLDDQFILQILNNKDKLMSPNFKNYHPDKICRSSMPMNNLNSKHTNHQCRSDPIANSTNHSLLKSEEMKSLLKHQIFLGMISLQADQVQSDVIDCINRLEQACIRFVFFSTDNQLRSRVFAERLGMESGWNCHISLAETDVSKNKHSMNTRRNSSKCTKTFLQEEIFKENILNKRVCSSEPLLHSATCESDQLTHSITLNDRNLLILPKDKTDVISSSKPFEWETSMIESDKSPDSTSSPSNSGISSKQDHSYLENPHDHFPEDKSKLPCGIQSIRPHLEEVDNVPLQVSLFTDCNPEVDHEMMSIMREYGEVICCCGSGLTVKNVSLFASNDCAVAFLPILHKQCWRIHENKSFDAAVLSKCCQPHKNQKTLPEEEIMLKKNLSAMNQTLWFPELSPINVACRLVALPCGLLLNRKAGFNLIVFITECHRLVRNNLSCIAFYCLSCVNFVILKFFFNFMILIFDICYHNNDFRIGFDVFPLNSQIVYHFYCHSPVIALVIYSRLSMLGKPLKEPPRKRGRLLTYKQCYRFIIASAGRFLPSVLICILTLLWNLIILHPAQPIDGYALNETLRHNMSSETLLVPVVVSDFIFVQHNVYTVIIAFVYIAPEKPFWKFNYLKNFRWLLFASLLTCLQIIYLVTSWQIQVSPAAYLAVVRRLYLPLIVSASGILAVLLFGFLATYWEKRALSVEHRLARLYFGTKLGMYSPV